jgi:hypothetical protein
MLNVKFSIFLLNVCANGDSGLDALVKSIVICENMLSKCENWKFRYWKKDSSCSHG